MNKVVYIDQGHPDDSYYDREGENTSHYMTRDLTLEELGLTKFIAQVEKYIDQTGPVLGKAVIDAGNMNEMCMKLTELKNRET